jgi:hypothetical protein
MAVTTEQLPIGRTPPPSPPASMPQPTDPPRLADGVELLGEYQDAGYSQPPSLVRRPDGQIIQMSPLLYQVTCRIDGSRDAAAIAELVSAGLGRSLSADQIRYLIAAKLLPLGIVTSQGSPIAPPRARPLFALRARGTLLPERALNAAAMMLRPLFRWPAVVAVTASFVGIDYWLFASHELGAGLEQILRNPIGLLVVVGLSVLSAAFHECGHATGPAGRRPAARHPCHSSACCTSQPGWRGAPSPRVCAGRQAVHDAASWPPRPCWRSWPRSAPCGPFRAAFTGGSQLPKIRSQARAAALPSSSGQNLAVNASYAARCADATASMSAIADTTSSDVASSGPGASAAKSK